MDMVALINQIFLIVRMRPATRNDQKFNGKQSNSTNPSPSRNFLSSNQSSQLIKALITQDSTPAKQMQQSKSPFQRHKYAQVTSNNPYQRYLVPSSVHKSYQSLTETKKAKSYLMGESSVQKKSTINNSTPTQYTYEDDPMSLKKKIDHKRQVSKVAVADQVQRPESSQSKKSGQSQVGMNSNALTLIQRIRDQQNRRPNGQQTPLLQYHQELIDKQYKKLLELQQHYQQFKRKNSTSDSKPQKQIFANKSSLDDVQSQLMNYIKSQSNKKLKGYRSISNPDIAMSLSKKLSFINRSAVITQAGRLHTGQTKTNQDSFFIKEQLMGKPNCWLLQVSDGHGTYGHLVAQFVREKLPQFTEVQLKQKKISGTDYSGEEINGLMNLALRAAFERTTRELYASGIDITFSGATTVQVIVLENELWCANIGDSRGIVARAVDRNNYQVVEISNDHKPDAPQEFKRVMQSGGRVQPYSDQDGNPVGPARVWLLEENIPGLAMSRSFGDYVASQVGVISIPEVLKHTLKPQDKFMIIASDGIWEFLSNDWIVSTVAEYYNNKDPEGACQRLVEEATLAWEREDEVVDDITCIVVFIGQEQGNGTTDKF